MANLSDIAIKGFDSLLSVKQEMEDADKKERERRDAEYMEQYKKTHIFSTIEEALQWCKDHPYNSIAWGCDTISWHEEKQCFQCFEGGEWGYNLVYRTEQYILNSYKETIKYLLDKYPNDTLESLGTIDENGKLSNVHINGWSYE